MSSAAQASPPTTAQELEECLGHLMVPDTATVQLASARLKVFQKKPSCVMPLIQMVSASQQVHIRQIAAVLLRRRILTLWRKLSAADQATIKTTLLVRLAEEPVRLVRLSIAELVSSVAKVTVPAGQWNELLAFLLEMSGAPVQQHREIAMMLFRALAENIGQALRPHFSTLQQIFVRALQDQQSIQARVEAVKALGCLVEHLNSDAAIAEFRTAVPHLVRAVQECMKVAQDPNASDDVQDSSAEAAVAVFEVFEDLVRVKSPILSDHFEIVMKLMLEIISSQRLILTFRDNACGFVTTLIQNKPIKVTKFGLLPSILNVAFALLLEPQENVFSAEFVTAQKIAVDLVDFCALHLPKEQVFQICYSMIMQFAKSPDALHRKAGLVVLATITEGTAELLMEADLANTLPLIIAATKDSEEIVRLASMSALIQYADHLEPAIYHFCDQILPCLFELLAAPTTDMDLTARICVALETYVENLDDKVLPFLEPLMQTLMGLFAHEDLRVKQTSIQAIQSVARAAGPHFVPFHGVVLGVIMQLMATTDDELLDIRCRATSCCGAIAFAIGKDLFAPYTKQAIDLAITGMSLDYFELRQAAHEFFVGLASTLKEDISVLLPTLVPLILSSIVSDDGVSEKLAGQVDDSGGGGGFDDFTDSEEDEDGEDGQSRVVMWSIRSGALDEKLAALHFLSVLTAQAGQAFTPFVAKTLVFLQQAGSYRHPWIRSNIMTCYEEIGMLMHKTFGGEITQQNAPVLETVMQEMLVCCQREVEGDVVQAALDGLTTVCRAFGETLLNQYLDPMRALMLSFLKGEANCQNAAEEDDDLEEGGEHDEVVIDRVMEVINVLVEVYGLPFFEVFFEPVAGFFAEHKSVHDRSMAMGTIGEMVVSVGKLGQKLPHAQVIAAMAFAGLAQKHTALRHNSAFAWGSLCHVEPAVCAPQFPAAFERLGLIIQECEMQKRNQSVEDRVLITRDNAVSAIAKMIMAAPDKLPIKQVVPLFLQHLPLERDFEEGEAAYGCISFLFAKFPQEILPFLPQVVGIIARVVEDDRFDAAKVCEPLKQLLQAFAQQMKAQLEQIVAGLPAELQQNIVRALS